MAEDLKSCCQNIVGKKNKKGLFQGMIYGIVPHAFCILFVIFSLAGSLTGASLMRRFLILPYFFSMLVALSLIFATISAFFYLRRNSCCTKKGIKQNWKYLTTLYSLTVLVNLAFIYLLFPAVIAKTNNEKNNNFVTTNKAVNELTIKVDIPCSGHAPLITDELKKVKGVLIANYIPQNTFEIYYDPNLANESGILSLEIFKTYKVTKI